MVRLDEKIEVRKDQLDVVLDEVCLAAMGVLTPTVAAVVEFTVGSAVAGLAKAILEHLQAVRDNDEFIKEASRMVNSVQSTLDVLAAADFPADNLAFLNIVNVLAQFLVALCKWGQYSWAGKHFSFSLHAGSSNALKYKKKFSGFF